MTWFNDTFLKSLFDRTGPGKSMWLTQKQTAICQRYMIPQETMRESRDYGRYVHYYYSAIWCNRSVILEYSQINGCGQIRFGLTLEEQKAQNQKISAEKDKIFVDKTIRRLQRYSKSGDTNSFNKLLNQIKEDISEVSAEIESLKENHASAEEIAEAEAWKRLNQRIIDSIK